MAGKVEFISIIYIYRADKQEFECGMVRRIYG